MKHYIFNINCERYARIAVRISASCVNWTKIRVTGVYTNLTTLQLIML